MSKREGSERASVTGRKSARAHANIFKRRARARASASEPASLASETETERKNPRDCAENRNSGQFLRGRCSLSEHGGSTGESRRNIPAAGGPGRQGRAPIQPSTTPESSFVRPRLHSTPSEARASTRFLALSLCPTAILRFLCAHLFAQRDKKS